MAYETGTATSYTDLLDKLKTFVTGAAITTEGNEWTVLRSSSTELILKGLGNSRDREIYCGIRTFLDGADSYQWEMRGFTGNQARCSTSTSQIVPPLLSYSP